MDVGKYKKSNISIERYSVILFFKGMREGKVKHFEKGPH
jgi:hypothetical protein